MRDVFMGEAKAKTAEIAAHAKRIISAVRRETGIWI
jgi:hypothetical protein